MARKTITKSKPATKPLVKKYQFAGANSSTYQQVANPYYVSSLYSEQSAQEADRAYKEAISLGDFAAAQQIKVDAENKARQEREKAALDQVKAETKLANQQEVQSSLSEGLNSGSDLALKYFKQRAIEKAATNAFANTAMQAGQAGVWAPVASAATPTAASVGLQGIAAPAMATTTTATTAGTSLLPGAVEVGSQVGQAAAAGTSAGVAGGTGALAASTPGVAGASGVGAGGAGASAAGTGASVGAGLATAGVGLGLNIGGTLLEKSGDDNDYTTFTSREKDRNLAGSAMKSAGTGVGIGAAIGSAVPVIGTVVGGAIGGIIGGGIGLIKGSKENKESKRIAEEYQQEQARIAAERAKAEKERKDALTRQKDILAQRYNQAFTSSRMMGMQTGFGYNTSTNMNMQPTSSFYGETGGARKVPGGQIVPIKGSDAVEFQGRPHSKGGIRLDGRTEVEGGETMDQVMMSGGRPNDYFFSKYLKLGGKSFAKHHKEILAEGGSQAKIQQLAKLQELAANKKGEKDRTPEQIAAYGGIHKYKMAGPEESAMAQSNMDAANVTLRDVNKAAANAPSDQQSVAPGKYTTNSGMVRKYQTGNFFNVDQIEEDQLPVDPLTQSIAGNNWAGHKKSNTTAPANGLMLIQSAVPGFEEREKQEAEEAKTKSAQTSKSTTGAKKGKGTTAKASEPYSARAPLGSRSVEGDEQGVSISMKGVPAGQGKGNKFYGNVTDQQYADMVKSNPWYDFSNFDPSDEKQVLNFQQEYNKRVKEGEKLQEDGKFGQQTATSRLYVVGEKMAGKDATLTPEEKQDLKKSTADLSKGEFTPTEEEKKTFKMNKGINGSLLAGLGQLIPVGYALARPYRTEGNLPRMVGGGNVGAGSVRGAILPRVNMNAERAAAERNTVAVKNMIQNTNAGPGGIAAMMAANSNMNQQMLTIANQEQEANKQLAAEEARLGQSASTTNAEMAQRANMANVQNQLSVNQSNLDAGIQEARLKIDEKRYKREEILGALDTAASRIAGIVKDEKSYKAQERLAKAIDNTGSYDRFTILEQLQKESKKKNSPYYGKTDAELKKIASDTYNEVIGKMGLEGGETAKTGGARKYTSRLGQLSRGRKTFNI